MASELKQMNILVIDDDPVFRNLLRSILKEKSNVFVVEAPSLAFKILKNEKIDMLICDFKLPEMNGLLVLEKVKKRISSCRSHYDQLFRRYGNRHWRIA
jgi:DNA-binding NtrC family response regulator